MCSYSKSKNTLSKHRSQAVEKPLTIHMDESGQEDEKSRMDSLKVIESDLHKKLKESRSKNTKRKMYKQTKSYDVS